MDSEAARLPRRGRDAIGEMTPSGLYARYHGLLLGLARGARAADAWQAKLREGLARFDDDCQRLSPGDRQVLRTELASQIETEVLQFSDPDKRAVLTLALKHIDVRD